MTGPAQPIEWYLARDNKQYGPLSDIELMKLVELRHLRDQDLVWRAGLTDWTPAPVAFPQAFGAQPEPQHPADPPVEAPPQASASQRPEPQAPAAEAPAAPETTKAPAPSPSAPIEASAAEMRREAHTSTPVSETAPIPAPARLQPAPDYRAASAPQAAAKIETLSEYRARLGARPDVAAAPAAAHDGSTSPTGGHSVTGHSGGGASLGTLRSQPDEDAAGAGPDRGRTATRRMWIAPADPDPSPGPTAPENQLRIDPTTYGAPQAQPQRPQPGYDRGFGSPHPGEAPLQAPQSRSGFAEQPLQPRWPEPQQRPDPGHALGGGPGPAFDPRPKARPAPSAVAPQDYEDEELDEEPPRRPRRLKGLIAILVLLAVMVGGTWLVLMNPQILDQPLRGLGLTTADGVVPVQGRPSSAATREQAAAIAKPAPAAALQDFPDNAGGIDGMLQKGRLWSIVREAFPEWYEERIREAAKMVAEKKTDEAVTKHVIDSLIALRRKNSDHAFQASLPALEQVARSFRDSLELLTKHSHVACYSLISNGEGTRGMVALFRDPTYSPTLQTGLAAVFQAVVEGRTTPRNNLPARRSDYDQLTKELQALGWKEQDINLFSDSESLAKTPPEQVCRMVREWFTAHLTIQDNEVRQRLLIESIKPVVAG